MIEENKARSRRLFEEAFGNHNLDVVDEIWGKNAVSMPMNLAGSDAVKQMITSTLHALPDLSATVEDQIAEGDTVATRVTFRGTHQGTFMGQYEPTGKPVSYTLLAMHKHADGKIVEGHGLFDMTGILRQINS